MTDDRKGCVAHHRERLRQAQEEPSENSSERTVWLDQGERPAFSERLVTETLKREAGRSFSQASLSKQSFSKLPHVAESSI